MNELNLKDKHINIAIDGPAGAGKSTLSRMLAKKLGFIYVDTGALYRAIGLFCLKKGIPASDADKVCPVLNEIDLKIKFENMEQQVVLNGKNVSPLIRTPEVSMAASAVSAIPGVREFLLNLQKDMAAKNNVVMDGRDIGTVILPKAEVKIFLTASAEERANRRYKEMIDKGEKADYNDVLDKIIKRDKADSEREIAPLKQAEDATLLDTTNMDLNEALKALIGCVKERL